MAVVLKCVIPCSFVPVWDGEPEVGVAGSDPPESLPVFGTGVVMKVGVAPNWEAVVGGMLRW